MKSIILILTIAISILGCAQKVATVVDAAKFAEGLKNENIQILDVRTIGEYNAGHIKNALQANWNNQTEFAARTQHLDKTKPLYIYCQAGGRSAAANAYLVQQGYANVVELKGGMIAWKNANQAVEGATETSQMTKADYDKLVADTTKTYIVDFGANWCPPCVKQKPIIDEIKKELGDKITVINIDGGVHTNLSKEMNVDAFPVLFIYKNGKQTMRFEGLTPKDMLTKEINK
jgi:rhodanese-related sulfurtransferase